MNFTAPCLFGVEGLLADELKRMGAENVVAENGRVSFSGDDSILARANIIHDLQNAYSLRLAVLLLTALQSFLTM